MISPIKNIETRFLINIANNSMFENAEKSIQKNYKLDKKENIYEQMTLKIVEDIESMIASQKDPNHWSLYGYKTLAEGWRDLDDMGVWKLRDEAIKSGEAA